MKELERLTKELDELLTNKKRENNLFTQTRTSKRNEMKKEVRVKKKIPIKNENAGITA